MAQGALAVRRVLPVPVIPYVDKASCTIPTEQRDPDTYKKYSRNHSTGRATMFSDGKRILP